MRAVSDRAPYRVLPPAPADLVDWPDDFGLRYTIFVDTEEEFDWTRPLDRGQRGTRAMEALPAAHRRFAERGVPLTYLVDHPIATSPRAVEILRRFVADGTGAVGTQLHPWVNPPHQEAVTPFNSFAGNLPRALEAAKIAELTRVIGDAFGHAPTAYRAGRYGIGPDTLSILAEHGYRIDSSMRAWYDYAPEGGPDFSAIGSHAFRCGPGGRLLELPLGTAFTGALRQWGSGIYGPIGRVPRGRGLLARTALLARVALTPEEMPIAEALEAVRVLAGEGVRVLNFSFHSPSVAPGYTPYVRDAADLRAFFGWWDRMLDALERLGARPASLAQVLAAAGTSG